MNICFDQIRADYRGKQILNAVSFCAESGRITALLGRNGAGKTTLLRCLTGEKRDYSGQILLDEMPVRSLGRGVLAGRIACLPQNLPNPHVTVRELVSFGRTPYTSLLGGLSAADREKVSWAMQSAGVEPLADAFVDTLSGGERKKAFFAMTLAQDTPVVVLDEPTAHLDTASRFDFLELVVKLCRQTGKTFLLVMHDLPEVFRYADRVAVLWENSLIFDGTPEACLAARIPQTCFGVELTGNRDTGFAAIPAEKHAK